MIAIHHSNPAALLTPPGPYSQVSRAGDLVFVAGQTGNDADNVLAGPGIAVQAEKALGNLRLALQSESLDLDRVVNLRIYVAGAEHLDELFPYMGEAFSRLFPAGPPSSTLLVVERLAAPELRIEIDAIAHA